MKALLLITVFVQNILNCREVLGKAAHSPYFFLFYQLKSWQDRDLLWLFNADIRQNFTLGEFNLEKLNKNKQKKLSPKLENVKQKFTLILD